jgi:acetylornithine deacetylase
VEVETHGRAAHGSRPLEGRDAIMRMGRVLGALESLDRRLQSGPTHPLLGTASLHASTVAGGREWSSYPDRCLLQVERRTLPGEADTVALEEARTAIETLRRDDPEFDGRASLMFGRQPYEIEASHPLPALLSAAAEGVGHRAHRVGMTFWTDAAILGAAGIPSVLFGPGGAGLHSVEEYVRLRDVEICRDALAALAHAFTRS